MIGKTDMAGTARVGKDGKVTCVCEASHSRGPIDGHLYRCLRCGRTFRAYGVHKWEIEPNPYDSSCDVCVTDDDQEARAAVMKAAEDLWDQAEPGREYSVKIRLNPSAEKADSLHKESR